jgi:hypothetical protein
VNIHPSVKVRPRGPKPQGQFQVVKNWPLKQSPDEQDGVDGSVVALERQLVDLLVDLAPLANKRLPGSASVAPEIPRGEFFKIEFASTRRVHAYAASSRLGEFLKTSLRCSITLALARRGIVVVASASRPEDRGIESRQGLRF